MASLKELIVNIKTKLNQSELVQGVNAIKQQINNIKDPHITPKVNTSPALAEFRKMKQAYQETKLEIKASVSQAVGSKFATGVSTTEVAAAGVGVGYAIKEAVDLDKAMMGVKKQVSETVDQSGNLTEKFYQIKDSIRELSRESGTSQAAVAGIFEEGGKSGLQTKEELVNYAKRVLYLKSAFDLTQESLPEFARSLNEYGAAMKMPNEELGVFTDKLNYLDDQISNVDGNALLDFSKRTAGTFKTAGISQDMSLSLGAASQHVGQNPEVIATAFNAVVPKLLTAKETFKKNDPFAAIGMTASQVQAGMVKDADKTLMTILESASKLDKVGQAKFFNDMAGTEHQAKFMLLASAVDTVTDSLNKVKSQEAKNSAQKEYSKQLGSISGQLDTLKTNMSDIVIVAGESLLPALIDLVKAITPIIREIGDWIKSHQEIVKNILMGITALVSMKLATMGLMFGVGALGTAFNVLRGAIVAIRGALMIARIAVLAFQAVTPMGWVILAINLVVTALIYMATHWDKVKQVAKSALDGIRQFSATVSAAMQNAFNSLIDGIVNRFIWLYNKAREVWTGIKSIFGGGNLSANANVKATIDNLSMRNTPSVPQAALSSYQQTYNSAVANNQKANTVNNNQKVTIQVAPNNSATQAQDIHKELEAQYRGTMRLAGTGFR